MSVAPEGLYNGQDFKVQVSPEIYQVSLCTYYPRSFYTVHKCSKSSVIRNGASIS